MISDQWIGLAGRVISGTPKDTLHFVDLVFNPDSDRRPEVLITDQGSYSDIVFAAVTLLGFDYRPVLADLPDTKLWRINRGADYAVLNRAARGQIDLEKITRHWLDILRVVCPIHTRTVSAHDVIRMRNATAGPPSSVRRSACTGGFSRPGTCSPSSTTPPGTCFTATRANCTGRIGTARRTSSARSALF